MFSVGAFDKSIKSALTMTRWLLVVVALLIISVGALIITPALMRDSDSPVARMYQTEADLASLANAIDAYHDAKGVYPPSGEVGLAVALDHISQTVDYFPDGAPLDGWGRAFHYVPHFAYPSKDSGALRGEIYFAPDTYQLYSLGEDGDSGKADRAAQADNITSWDRERSWRNVYDE